MSVPETIDFEALLAPISEENPAGEDPRDSNEWVEVKQARQSHGENDPLGESEVVPADWEKVINLGAKMLTERGKHIEVACDMTEALVREHGFAGLRDGLRLIREIQEKFWDGVYPRPEGEDEADMEDALLDRSGPLNGLNTNIVNAMETVEVTGARGQQNFSWLLYKDSRYVENVGRKDPAAKSQLVAEGRADPALVNAAIGATPWQFYETATECLNEAAAELKKLDDLIDEKYGAIGDEGPTLQRIREAIEECRVFCDRNYQEKKPGGAALPPEPGGGEEAGAPVPVFAGGVPLEPLDRADALRRLRAVAQFFRQTEPHSPVAHLVERAAMWGDMTLDDWLKEVVKDQGVLGQLRELLAIKPPEEEGGGTW